MEIENGYRTTNRSKTKSIRKVIFGFVDKLDNLVSVNPELPDHLKIEIESLIDRCWDELKSKDASKASNNF